MPASSFFTRRIHALCLLVALGACGGETVGTLLPGSGSGGSGGVGGSGGSGGSGGLRGSGEAGEAEGGASESDAQTCVDIDLSTYDVSCNKDSDCVRIHGGTICDGYYADCYTLYGCGEDAVNGSEESRYQSTLSAVTPSPPAYSCPECASLSTRCLNHTCAVCGLTTPNANPLCASVEPPPADGGGSGAGDGGVCIDIDLAAYDRSCTSSADCISITSGQICSGACACGGSAVNASGAAQYDAALSGLELGICGCPFMGLPQCVGGTCAVCGHADSPTACPDGG
jgi:hypothetical protein